MKMDGMKAAFLYGVKDLRIEETTIPSFRDDEVLVRVRSCGICPSDLRYYLGYRKSIPYGAKSRGLSGHEWAGDVVEVGSEVEGISEGERVVPGPIVSCGNCKFCVRGESNLCVNKTGILGGFAGYAKALAKNIYKVPENLSYKEACMTEPVACCLNANILSKIQKGDDVVIVGDGPMGLIHLQLAKASAARVTVSGHHRERLEVAEKLGADKIVNSREEDVPQIVKDLTDGYGADAVIVSVGNKRAIEEAMQMVGVSGVVNLFAGTYPPAKVALDPNLIHYGQIVLTGSSDSTPYLWETALKLISLGVVKTKPLISHTFPLSQLKEGFEALQKRKGLKVMITPTLSDSR